LLLVSCRVVNIKKKWKKGQKIKCVLVHMTIPFIRQCLSIRCFENAVVVLKDNMDIKATRVKGVVFKELKYTKFRKLYTLGDYVL
jgi:ribosomal protein L14